MERTLDGRYYEKRGIIMVGQRRKMLAKNLTPFLSKYGKSREAFENHLQSMGLEVTLRAEQVSVENFHQLYNWIVE